MLNLNIENIIYGTPEKKLLVMYDKLKQNYTEEEAEKFQEAYVDESFEFMIDNSEKIFAETYYGFDFYAKAMYNLGQYCPAIVRSEKGKVDSFIEARREDMGEEQLMYYESLSNNLGIILKNNKAFEVVESVINHENEGLDLKLCNALFHENYDEVKSLLSESSNVAKIAYGPKISAQIKNVDLSPIYESLVTDYTTNKDYKVWSTFAECVVASNKLLCDENYKESVQSLPRQSRNIVNYFGDLSIKTIFESVNTVELDSHEALYESPSFAINMLYNDMDEANVYKESESEEKAINESIKYSLINATLKLLLEEYSITENTTDTATGYTYFDTDISIEEAVSELNELVKEYPIYTEESSSDFSDDEIDQVLNDDKGAAEIGKKPQAPLLSKVRKKTYSNMDREAEYFQKSAERKQRGAEKAGLIRSATAIPRHVLDSINEQIRALDNRDLKRRERYMVEPGFRKKGIRNLKLALLYGTAAQIKLSLIPITMICRHFSKVRDVRVRNELIRDLEINIKICDEKINDASQEGARLEKYKLIRIKGQLEKELLRVRTNSKYV